MDYSHPVYLALCGDRYHLGNVDECIVQDTALRHADLNVSGDA